MTSHDDDNAIGPVEGSTEQNEPPSDPAIGALETESWERAGTAERGLGVRSAGAQPGRVELRDVEPDELAGLLRAVLDLPTDTAALGEGAGVLHPPMPSVIHGLDASGWLAWCMSGLTLFVEHLPTMNRVRLESKRVVAGLAMLRADGNMTAAARALGITRKVLRDNLRAVNLYPWYRGPEESGDGT